MISFSPTNSIRCSGRASKCNPAIKRPTDRDDLRFALSHDVIDTIATDHAPHILAEKQGTALTAASGMPSVQWALPVMMQTVAEGWFSLPTIVLKMCTAPALLYGIEGRGALVEGYKADMVLFDTDAEPWRITDEACIGRAGWTPYAGLEINGRVDATSGQWPHGLLGRSGASGSLGRSTPALRSPAADCAGPFIGPT